MPKTKQPAEKRKAYAKSRTLFAPMKPKEMLSPFKSIERRKRTVYGDKKK